MGILYKASKELMRQNYIQDLLMRGVTENKQGISIHNLDYYELRHLIAVATFHEKDVENDSNKWF